MCGNIFFLGLNVITSSSRKQEIVTLSTTEVEYTAATSTACQAVWLRRMISALSMNQLDTTVIYCDNKSTISIVKNPTLHGKTKYIDIRLHFIRSLISNGVINLKNCSIEDHMADIFIKPLPIQKHMFQKSSQHMHISIKRGF